MKALDLFCKAGGASAGLVAAGFDVVGVDIEPQPRYPYSFIQADALRFPLTGFDFIWASPPCQAYTRMRKVQGREHPDLIGSVREKLKASGKPYVIENVVGAPLDNPHRLCGAMFGLKMYRHRLFECSFPVTTPAHPKHVVRTERAGRLPKDGGFISVAGHFPGVALVRETMGVPWMSRDEISQAIPPAFSQFIGEQFLRRTQ